jgi:hypothetical protein
MNLFTKIWNLIPFLPKIVPDGPCRKHYWSTEPFKCEKCGCFRP